MSFCFIYIAIIIPMLLFAIIITTVAIMLPILMFIFDIISYRVMYFEVVTNYSLTLRWHLVHCLTRLLVI